MPKARQTGFLSLRSELVLFLLLTFCGAECVAATESASCSAAESISGTVTSSAGAPLDGRALVVLEEGVTRPRERVPWFVPVHETMPDPSGDFRLCGGHGGALLLVIAVQDTESLYPATLVPDVKSGTALGKIAVGAPAHMATAPTKIQGLVVSATARFASTTPISLAVIASVNRGAPETEFKYTVPLVAQESATLQLALQASPACAGEAACAGYTVSVPSQSAVVLVAGGKVQRKVAPIYQIEARVIQGADRPEGCAVSSSTLRQPNGHWLAGKPGLLMTASPLRLEDCRRTTEQETRHYTPVVPSKMANNRRTHVEVTGRVTEVSEQADGDIHLRLEDSHGFVIAECIPSLPDVRRRCAALLTGGTVTVRGISRYDFEHNWWEVHPVLEVIPRGSP